MPDPVSREAYTRIQRQVIENAPPGLSREDFQARLDAALRQAESGPSLAERAINEWGLAETAGGLAGGALGTVLGPEATIPGAMAGAGAVRYIRGRMRGETRTEAALPAAWSAALEAIPFVGRGMRFVGRRMIRSALPITEKTALQLGKGSKARGVEELTRRAEAIPGVRLGKAAEYVGESPGPGRTGAGRLAELAGQRGRAVAAAERAGAEIQTRPIIRAGRALIRPGGALREQIGLPPSGAKRVLKDFVERVTKERPMTATELRATRRSMAALDPAFRPVVSEAANLSPREADAILQNTKFFSGARDIPGAETAGRTLRTQLSRELKRAVPAVKAPMAEQRYLLPVQRALDRALARGGSQVRAPAIYLSGGRPRMFGVLAPTARTTFGVGKALSRLGGPLGASPTAQRLLPGSLRALLLQLAAQDWPPP